MKNILLVSESPVAGTVQRFAAALENSGKARAVPFILKPYKNGSFDIYSGAMGCYQNWFQLLEAEVTAADTIVLHNVADENIISLIYSCKKSTATTAYHYHSPPFEGPLYSYNALYAASYDTVFCPAQGHSRFYEDAVAIPNIVDDINLLKGVHRRNHIFLGHLRSTDRRWSMKTPINFLNSAAPILRAVGSNVTTIKDLFGIESVPSAVFRMTLQGFDFVIDDICSGQFHQTAIEALKSNCIVLSAADEIALQSFSETVNAPQLPFDLVSHPDLAAERARHYILNPSELKKKKEQIQKYCELYLKEKRIEEIFVKKFLANT